MTSDINPNPPEDVNINPDGAEDKKVLDTGKAMDELFGADVPPTEEKKGVDGKPVVPAEDAKPDDKKPAEVDPNEPATPPEEPYLKVGNFVFKDRKSAEAYMKKQIGYNASITGELKKLHPELFSADGTLKLSELRKTIKDADTKAPVVTEAKPALTDEEKKKAEDIESAKKILKELGVIFKDDEELTAAKNTIAELQEEKRTAALDKAKDEIATFAEAHPIITEHYNELAKFMKGAEIVDLEKGWGAFKLANDIVEEPLTPADASTGAPVAKVLPVAVKKGTGAPPSSQPKKEDFFDEILGATGWH